MFDRSAVFSPYAELSGSSLHIESIQFISSFFLYHVNIPPSTGAVCSCVVRRVLHTPPLYRCQWLLGALPLRQPRLHLPHHCHHLCPPIQKQGGKELSLLLWSEPADISILMNSHLSLDSFEEDFFDTLNYSQRSLSLSVSDQHEHRCSVNPGEWEVGETQAAGGRGRLGAVLRRKHAGYSSKINNQLQMWKYQAPYVTDNTTMTMQITTGVGLKDKEYLCLTDVSRPHYVIYFCFLLPFPRTALPSYFYVCVRVTKKGF